MGEAALNITTQVIIAVVGFAVTWGMVLSRMRHLEESFLEHEAALKKHIDDTREKYVSLVYFHAVIKPMQEQLAELSHDTKKILMIVSRYTDDIN